MRILFYVLSIVLANIITAAFAPFSLGLLVIPYGTLLIGLTFILRDLVQLKIGKKKTYIVIVASLLVSAMTSYLLGDTLWIVFASMMSFLVSELADTEIFSRLKDNLGKRILFSGVVGGTLDSSLFVIIGLSPIGAGFLPWGLVIFGILGQVVVKSIMQFIAYGIYLKIRS